MAYQASTDLPYRYGDVVLLPFGRTFNPGLSMTAQRPNADGQGEPQAALVTLPLDAPRSLPPAGSFLLERFYAPAIALGATTAPHSTSPPGSAHRRDRPAMPGSFPYVDDLPEDESDILVVRPLSHPEAVISMNARNVMPWSVLQSCEAVPSPKELRDLLVNLPSILAVAEADRAPFDADLTEGDEASTGFELGWSRQQIVEEALKLDPDQKRRIVTQWRRLWKAWAVALEMSRTTAEQPKPDDVRSRYFPSSSSGEQSSGPTANVPSSSWSSDKASPASPIFYIQNQTLQVGDKVLCRREGTEDGCPRWGTIKHFGMGKGNDPKRLSSVHLILEQPAGPDGLEPLKRYEACKVVGRSFLRKSSQVAGATCRECRFVCPAMASLGGEYGDAPILAGLKLAFCALSECTVHPPRRLQARRPFHARSYLDVKKYRPDPNTVLWAAQDEVASFADVPTSTQARAACAASLEDPAVRARTAKTHYRSHYLHATYPTILSDAALHYLPAPLIGFDPTPSSLSHSYGLSVVDTEVWKWPLPSNHEESSLQRHRLDDVVCLPSVLACPTVHPANAAHIPLWQPVRILTPELFRLMSSIYKQHLDAFIHWAIPRPTLLGETYAFPVYYWKTQITCDSCHSAGRPCVHASTLRPTTRGIPLQCADCAIHGQICSFAISYLKEFTDSRPARMLCTISARWTPPDYSRLWDNDDIRPPAQDPTSSIPPDFRLSMVYFQGIENFVSAQTGLDTGGHYVALSVGSVDLPPLSPSTEDALAFGSSMAGEIGTEGIAAGASEGTPGGTSRPTPQTSVGPGSRDPAAPATAVRRISETESGGPRAKMPRPVTGSEGQDEAAMLERWATRPSDTIDLLVQRDKLFESGPSNNRSWPHVDIVVPLPADGPDGDSSALLGDLPSRGRALISDMALLTIVDGDGRSDLVTLDSEEHRLHRHRPHLCISLRARNVDLATALRAYPSGFAPQVPRSTRAYDAKTATRVRSAAHRLVEMENAGPMQIVREAAKQATAPGIGVGETDESDNDGWNDLTEETLACYCLAAIDPAKLAEAPPPLTAAAQSVLLKLLGRYPSDLRCTYARPPTDLLSTSSRPRVSFPILLGRDPKDTYEVSSVLALEPWSETTRPYSDSVADLLDGQLQTVNRIEDGLPRRTWFLPQGRPRDATGSPAKGPAALCGCIRMKADGGEDRENGQFFAWFAHLTLGYAHIYHPCPVADSSEADTVSKQKELVRKAVRDFIAENRSCLPAGSIAPYTIVADPVVSCNDPAGSGPLAYLLAYLMVCDTRGCGKGVTSAALEGLGLELAETPDGSDASWRATDTFISRLRDAQHALLSGFDAEQVTSLHTVLKRVPDMHF